MNTERAKRKLSAILSADVKGYSRLMGEDEVGTVRTLKEYRELMSRLIKEYRGRVVDCPGDNVLAEFGSVVDALECSIEIQKVLKSKNAGLPDNRKMEFRIGVNLGDVIEDEERVYGDGVNIAARIEGLAEPGGICISGMAFDQIGKRLPLGYEYMGEQTVKNIEKPVRVYRVLREPGSAGKVIGEKKPRQTTWGWKAAAAVAVFVLVAGGIVWNFYWRAPKIEPASKEKMAFPLPDKPSIAVLPFANMSDDPKQEFFSDGMTEDLITDLSKIAGLFVIARNSTFTYKGKPVKIRQVAEDLGVRYVLEGSVRRVGDQVRINAQLIDAITGQHLWAERYDGSIRDVFSLQDKINQKITAALAVKLTGGEKALVKLKGTYDPVAYEEFLRGREHYLRFTKEDYAKAEVCFKKAVELAPDYSQAKASLALLYLDGATNGLHDAFKMSYVDARLHARLWLVEALKTPTSTAYQVAGLMDLYLRQHDEAISAVEKALALDPNDPACHLAACRVLNLSGKPGEGMEHGKIAMRLDPLNPARYLAFIGVAHFCKGEWQDAVAVCEKALRLNPEALMGSLVLASAYAHLGRDEEAKAAVQIYRRISSPGRVFTPRGVMYFWAFKDRTVADAFVAGLRRAGLFGAGPEYIHVSKKDQLTGEELKSFLYPSKFVALGPDGSLGSREAEKDGTTTLRASWLSGGVDTGKSWVEGDKVWIRLEKSFSGVAACSTYFKNPGGTPQGKDEYVNFSDLWMSTFSLAQ